MHRSEKLQLVHELQFFRTSKGKGSPGRWAVKPPGAHGAGTGLWSSALCIFLPQKALKIIAMPTSQGLVFVEHMGLGLLSLALLAGSL